MMELKTRTKSMFFIILFACMKGSLSYKHVTCDRLYNKVGCLDKSDLFGKLLVNDRDVTSSHFQGYIIQWGELGASLHSLLCRCSKIARQQGYSHIAIRYFAECWGAKNLRTVQLLTRHPKSNSCVQDRYKSCSNYGEGECAGKDGSEYVYELINTVQSGAIDGKWSSWSEWTTCSTTCGMGEKSRERSCTNPEPSGTGTMCHGASSEVKKCFITECPAIADSTGNPECEKRIKGLYLAILHRNPDDEGFIWHLGKCKRGYTHQESFNNIYESNERRDLDCEEKVNHLYKNILKIEKDSFYESYRTFCLNGGAYSNMVKHILQRADFTNYDHTKYPTACHKRVYGLYVAIYHDFEQMERFEHLYEECMASKTLDAQIQAMMSTKRRKVLECKVRVNHLFSDMLHRRGMDSELSFHVNRCVNDRSFLYQVYEIIYSPEFEEKYRNLPPRVTATNEI